MSLRAVGEGHLSSIGFRTGVVAPDGDVRFDEPGAHLATGRREAVVTTGATCSTGC